MVTVAKGIDAPVLLKFPYDYTNPSLPKFSILGLGDIVLPGLLIAFCMRFDFVNSLNLNKIKSKVDEIHET